LAGLWNECYRNHEEIFYKTVVGNLYVYDLTAWHLRDPKVKTWIEKIVSLAYRNILDFGCGIGTYSLNLIKRGLQVTAVDINPVLLDFVKWRLKKRGFTAKLSPVMPNCLFDTIVAIDTIEHLSDPAAWLCNALARLNRKGQILVTWHFHDCAGAHPMHVSDKEKVMKFFDIIQDYCRHELSDGIQILRHRI